MFFERYYKKSSHIGNIYITYSYNWLNGLFRNECRDLQEVRIGERWVSAIMILIGRKNLKKLKEKNHDFKSQAESWEAEVEDAKWENPHSLKKMYPKASIIGHQNVVFNVCGNRFRIWVRIDYRNRVALIKKAGTHKEYEKWKIK